MECQDNADLAGPKGARREGGKHETELRPAVWNERESCCRAGRNVLPGGHRLCNWSAAFQFIALKNWESKSHMPALLLTHPHTRPIVTRIVERCWSESWFLSTGTGGIGWKHGPKCEVTHVKRESTHNWPTGCWNSQITHQCRGWMGESLRGQMSIHPVAFIRTFFFFFNYKNSRLYSKNT